MRSLISNGLADLVIAFRGRVRFLSSRARKPRELIRPRSVRRLPSRSARRFRAGSLVEGHRLAITKDIHRERSAGDGRLRGKQARGEIRTLSAATLKWLVGTVVGAASGNRPRGAPRVSLLSRGERSRRRFFPSNLPT